MSGTYPLVVREWGEEGAQPLVLDALGIERASFVGYSWGASLGCHLGARSPARLSALVLLDAGYQDVEDDGTSLEARIEEAHRTTAEFVFEGWDAFSRSPVRPVLVGARLSRSACAPACARRAEGSSSSPRPTPRRRRCTVSSSSHRRAPGRGVPGRQLGARPAG